MPRPRKSVPRYLPHGSSNRARAVWTDLTGKRHFQLLPGKFDSAESKAAFHRLGLELESQPLQQPDAEGDTVADVLLAYRLHADKHYRGPDGNPTSAIYSIKNVIKAVRELYADTPVAEFGPLCVMAARQHWVNDGCSRKECNRRVGVVKRIFKWAASMQLAPITTCQAIATIEGLQRGRTEARELEAVGPVDDATVDTTLPYLNRHVRGLIEFQRLTGCRPGEACTVRRSEIDTGGAVWLYKPTHHKTAHRGKSRTIAIGPRAQELLREYFTTSIEDYLFSPRRALDEVRGKPVKAKFRMRSKKKAPKEQYDRTTYTRAIARACEKIYPLPEHLAPRPPQRKLGIKAENHKQWWKRLTTEEKAEVRAWREAHRWAPNQLRHSFATRVRKQFSGLEHAGAALGHSKMSATEVYAERDAGLAVEVAARMG